MRTVGSARALATVTLVLLLVTGAAHAGAGLRISDLDLALSHAGVTVDVALEGTIPAGFHEAIQSGIAAHVRYTIELWQYNRLWRDRLVHTAVVERQLEYNVVTKEFRVTSVTGESRPALATRELGEAQRALSRVSGLALRPPAGLDPAETFYVRAQAESSLNGENTFITRMAGTAERASRETRHHTLTRTP